VPRRNRAVRRSWQHRDAQPQDLPQPTTGQLARELVLRGLASPGILDRPLSPADLMRLPTRPPTARRVLDAIEVQP